MRLWAFCDIANFPSSDTRYSKDVGVALVCGKCGFDDMGCCKFPRSALKGIRVVASVLIRYGGIECRTKVATAGSRPRAPFQSFIEAPFRKWSAKCSFLSDHSWKVSLQKPQRDRISISLVFHPSIACVKLSTLWTCRRCCLKWSLR